MLQPKDRAKLRAMASAQNDIVFVGQNGVTDTVVKEVCDTLHAYELIKIKVQKGAVDTPKDIADELSNKTDSEVVCVIGNKIVLYKYSAKKNIKHVLA